MDYVIRTGLIAICVLLTLGFVNAGIWGDITEQYFNAPKDTTCEYITDYYNPDGSYGGIIKQYDTTCLFLNGMKSINQMNQNITFTGNGIDTNTIMAEAIYTKSKIPTPEFDYCKAQLEADIFNKATHYAYKFVNGKFVLDSELRDVYAEGCRQQQLISECVLHNGVQSWCVALCTSSKNKGYNWCK